ncbi:1384_t:CDS:2, partial [Gigaspora rosea]
MYEYFCPSPKITFFEKFAEKRQQRQVIKTLLEQGLLPLDAVKPNTFFLNYDALSDFNLEIIWKELYDSDTNLLWKQFGLWAFFATSSYTGKQIRNHCQCLWSKSKSARKKLIASELTKKMSKENIDIKDIIIYLILNVLRAFLEKQ